MPRDGPYFALPPQALAPNPEGRFVLFRVGGAVASRNINAAIYDFRRLCFTF